MDLQDIADAYASSIESIDAEAAGAMRVAGDYLPGFASMNEEDAVRAIDDQWASRAPGLLAVHRTKVSIPSIARAKIDHVLTPLGYAGLRHPDQWGLEVKRLQFFGNNGGRNDYSIGKSLSPYLRDRGMLHDALRLHHAPFTDRVGVLGYGFSYDPDSIRQAFKAHAHDKESMQVLVSIEKDLRLNGPIRLEPLLDLMDAVLGLRGLRLGPRVEAPFTAWTHPAGGNGLVFGWEIKPVDWDGYDQRHRW